MFNNDKLKAIQQENDRLKLEIFRLNKEIERLKAHQILEYNFIVPATGDDLCDFSQDW